MLAFRDGLRGLPSCRFVHDADARNQVPSEAILNEELRLLAVLNFLFAPSARLHSTPINVAQTI